LIDQEKTLLEQLKVLDSEENAEERKEELNRQLKDVYLKLQYIEADKAESRYVML
jgi:hypothetical protein